MPVVISVCVLGGGGGGVTAVEKAQTTISMLTGILSSYHKGAGL